MRKATLACVDASFCLRMMSSVAQNFSSLRQSAKKRKVGPLSVCSFW